ncbi:MAG: DUF4157 domain-containing protein [Fibrobacter sp.]|nr:DUF4157 domain-containing protein [Fibrobacter sp.]
MQTIYAQKNENAVQKKRKSSVSIIDSSSQSESLQRKADMANNAAQREEAPRPNNTGMPDNLKAGIESLSGFSMDDVRVHYNSSKPATVQALAYTQGTDIHVAPGQEKHLPHEAWHVAQQMADRVSPTTNINGMPVNDNAALEHEADVMGEKAVTQKKKADGLNEGSISEDVCQRTEIHYTPKMIKYTTKEMPEVFALSFKRHRKQNPKEEKSVEVGYLTKAILSPGHPIKGTGPGDHEQKELMEAIECCGAARAFCRGHLLNHQLGGLGIAQNMIPITESANTTHENNVEQGVKNLVYANEIVKKHKSTLNDSMFNSLYVALDKAIKSKNAEKIKEAREAMSVACMASDEKHSCKNFTRVNGENDIIYTIQADLLSNQPVSRANRPEVSLKCSVQYGERKWEATINSGPKPLQSSAIGNITTDINDFIISPHCIELPSILGIHFLNVEESLLRDVEWGGLHTDSTAPNKENLVKGAENLDGSGIIIQHDGDGISGANTYIHNKIATEKQTKITDFFKPIEKNTEKKPKPPKKKYKKVLAPVPMDV